MTTAYPARIDTAAELPTVVDGATPLKASVINILRDAVIAVETELGIKPSGIYTTVRSRLDAIENIIDTLVKGGEILPLGGDLGGFTPSASVLKLRGMSLPATSTLTVGNILQASTSTSLAYGPLNLAGGANYVTGSLPTANQARQSMGGDISGLTNASTVVAMQTHPISASTPSDGDVLTWDLTNNNWVGAPVISTTVTNLTALRDLANPSTYGTIFVKGHTTSNDGGGGTFIWNTTSTDADDNGITIAVTGVVTGRWKRFFQGSINVKWFGAAGNGTTNDYTAINSAITAISPSGKGTIYFGTGTYKTSINLTFNANTKLEFEPGAILAPDVGMTITISSIVDADYNQQIFSVGSSFGKVIIPDNVELSVGWWGAKGNGVTDDTAALQGALDGLMATTRGGKLFFPTGTYPISYTLHFLGDYGHNYVLESSISGLSEACRLLWTGPSGCTMLNCWGLNLTHFNRMTFDGGGRNLLIGGYSDPAVAVIGAGAATWFHTNQYSSASHPGITGGAATYAVYFDDCSWAGVIGSLNAACSLGDGNMSPGCLTVDPTGSYTLYSVVADYSTSGTITTVAGSPNVTGVNTTFTTVFSFNGVTRNHIQVVDNNSHVQYYAIDHVVDNTHLVLSTNALSNATAKSYMIPPDAGANALQTCHQTTLTANTAQWGTDFVVNDVTGFVVNNAILISIAGKLPWCGRITAINTGTKTISAIDNGSNGLGIPSGVGYAAPIGTRAYNCYPNPAYVPIDNTRTVTLVILPDAIQNSEVQGFAMSRGNGFGGGYDTTNSGQYCYACWGLYSGYNAEQYWWRDATFGVQGMVFGIYSPTNPNNEFFCENIQFGNFSGAGVWLGINNSAKLNMYQCATESGSGFGLFVYDSAPPGGGTVNIVDCEILYNCIGNPYYYAVYSQAPTHIERCTISNQYYDLGTDAEVPSIYTGGNLVIEHCSFYGETLQIPIFNNGIEIFSDYFGTVAHPLTNRTHAWNNGGTPSVAGQQNGIFANSSIRLFGNTGNSDIGNSISLRDVNYSPIQEYTIGPLTNSYTPAATEVYRSVPRIVTSCFDVNCNGLGDGGVVYTTNLQVKMVLKSIVVEVTETFSTATTLDIGSFTGGFTDLINGISAPVLHGVITNFITSAPMVANTWATGDVIGVRTNTGGPVLATGKLRIYITTEMMQP